MKILVLGATGRSGRRLVRMGMAGGHELTAFVRSRDKLTDLFGGSVPTGLIIKTGDVTDVVALITAMAGQDAVINAAGNAMKTEGYVPLVTGVIHAAESALGPGGRFWLFGSVAALDVPGTNVMGVDLPRMQEKLRSHKSVYEVVRTSNLDWSMLCPGKMVQSDNGEPHKCIRVSTDIWPFGRPDITRLLPRIALSFLFRRKRLESTISFEDAAKVILDNLHPNGPLSRKRVGVARPLGFN